MKKRMMIISTGIVVGGLAAGLGTMGITHAATQTSSPGVHKIGRLIRGNDRVRLNQAERDGTITSAQETAFKTEVKTLKGEYKAAITSSSTTQQRQAERTKLKGELKTWATTNNFPFAKIFPKLAS